MIPESGGFEIRSIKAIPPNVTFSKAIKQNLAVPATKLSDGRFQVMLDSATWKDYRFALVVDSTEPAIVMLGARPVISGPTKMVLVKTPYFYVSGHSKPASEGRIKTSH